MIPAGAHPLMRAGGDPLDEIYRVNQSLRFASSRSTYLNRTPSVAGNRQKWTLSIWAKKAKTGATLGVLEAGASSGDTSSVRFSGDDFSLQLTTAGGYNTLFATPGVWRDPAAYTHFVLSLDTTQASQANMVAISVNGKAQAVSVSQIGGNAIPQNSQWHINSTTAHYIGTYLLANYFDGCVAEMVLVGGQVLDASYFGTFHPVTGQWRPKAYTGAYGTNGFYLPWNDNSNTTAATLGADRSGNGNNWTPNNFSVTAGSNCDWTLDSPTNVYCTLNPLAGLSLGNTYSNGNLTVDSAASSAMAVGTLPMRGGKWYFETTWTYGQTPATQGWNGGITTNPSPSAAGSSNGAYGPTDYVYQTTGSSGTPTKANNATYVSYGGPAGNVNDVIGVAVDLVNGTIRFYRNGTDLGIAYSGLDTTLTYYPYIGNPSTGPDSGVANFGQQPQSGGSYYSAARGYFKYAPPSGFVALCTKNFSYPTIIRSKQYFDAAIYAGNGSPRSISVDGLGNNLLLQPDLVWVKDRSAAAGHILVDSARGATKTLSTNSTNTESTNANSVTAFNANGFSIGTGSNVNANGDNFAAWLWRAAGAAVTNNAGSIVTQVNANPVAGFSVVTGTAPAAGAFSFGHGLGVVPKFIIFKNLDAATGWNVYHASLNGGAPGASYYLDISSANGQGSTAGMWGAGITSSVIGGTVGTTITANNRFVAYVFAEVPGFSKFGSYLGNGSSDGPFAGTGFRSRFIITKNINRGTTNWAIIDCNRDPYNVANHDLRANTNEAETAIAVNTPAIDIVSNGFKLRSGPGDDANYSGETQVFAAFAEFPTRYANAR